ncbi:DUF1461 domain-containing protein [Thalassotalea sp. HSM 43]|uniref:lipoprotein intramolecular transacylase Lit n=1 Tax=Thalassotalea sp. HSM 43 TaxID=2552945 RepID=UPI0010806FE5|nr:DUF1461 domain-containing protein [Thalassotalea sp. HSM 43]QBY03448.1 DUF1461 domain-containing protein [Thalassotalea sp. HSM 43]
MTKHSKKSPYYSALWLFKSISLIIVCLGFSWIINSNLNFTYSVWYELLDIDQHIATYAPQNKFGKQDFANTEKAQHVELFARVVESINNSGEGLDAIQYQVNGQNKALYTNSEVVHLQDVSNLVDKLTLMCIVVLLFFVLLQYLCIAKPYKTPSAKIRLITSSSFVLGIVLLFAIIGFRDIFYYLHTVVFPDEHQWFFYYQESLMSTAMKAPDLFAALAINLVVVAAIVFVLINHGLKKFEGLREQ